MVCIFYPKTIQLDETMERYFCMHSYLRDFEQLTNTHEYISKQYYSGKSLDHVKSKIFENDRR